MSAFLVYGAGVMSGASGYHNVAYFSAVLLNYRSFGAEHFVVLMAECMQTRS